MQFAFSFYLLVTCGYLFVTCGYLVVTSVYLIAATDVLLDRIKHEFLLYCSNLVANSCFLNSNSHKYHI